MFFKKNYLNNFFWTTLFLFYKNKLHENNKAQIQISKITNKLKTS